MVRDIGEKGSDPEPQGVGGERVGDGVSQQSKKVE